MGKINFRDVSLGLQKLRNFLLGRKHVLHIRYPPHIASRTIPPPEIPRGPEEKYSDQWYYKRCAMHSVKPPVVAPYPDGVCAGVSPTALFDIAPAPGLPWWWDGHCYYEAAPATDKKCSPTPKCPPDPPKCPSPPPKCDPKPEKKCPPKPKCPPEPPKCPTTPKC